MLAAKAVVGTKILWLKGRAGSIPAPGTLKELILKIGSFCFKYSCAFKMSALAEEEKHITSFWKHLDEFPDDVPQKQDPPEPDFFVNVDQGLIGIELSTFIAEFVTHRIPPSGEHWYFEHYDSYRNAFNFPHDKKIRSIAIANCDHKVSQPCWTHTESGVVPQVYESQAFGEILKKKNQKPSNYLKNYYQIWLLMVEDQWSQAAYFDFKDSEEPTLSSPFDRIFIFRYLTEEIIELKVVKV